MEKKQKQKRTYGYGKWVEKKTQSLIFTCSCGEKYLKTREGQKTCIKCMVKV